MSADRPDPAAFLDTRHADAQADRYGIVPEGFCAAYGESTIRAALRAAERAPTTTPAGELRRCPNCGSVRVHGKPGHREIPNKRSEAHKCNDCGEHFDETAPSADDSAPGRQATFREVCER